MSEQYVTIHARIIGRTNKAVRLQQEGETRWIPRSCIHGVDEQQIDSANVGQELDLRIFEWLAKREGLV
ncbi:MAG TPA: hypothetical protein VKR31_10260 [Rhizomicrobium sp.]|nr:hypothetical protein [Rhizomicrobium sp.]